MNLIKTGEIFEESRQVFRFPESLPVIVPMGFVHGLPAGISFTEKAWSEPLLMDIAYSYVQGIRHHKAPGLLETGEKAYQLS